MAIFSWIQLIKKNLTLYFTLRKTKLFSDLSSGQINVLAQKSILRHFHPGEIVIQEGSEANCCYVVLSGKVEVFITNPAGTNIVLTHLTARDYFGEQALLEFPPVKRNASVKAITDVNLIEISESDFAFALNASPKIKFGLRIVGNKQLLHRLTKQLDIFQSLKKTAINELANNIMIYQHNDVIFKKGDDPDFIYYLIEGNVLIYLDDQVSNSYIALHAGQIFGELSFLENQKRKGTAIARGLVKLLAIPYNIFNELYLATPKLRDMIGSLKQIYKNPSRGIVIYSSGEFLGEDTINATFNLPDGRVVFSSLVIGQNIFSITQTSISPDQKILYSHDAIKREIQIKDNKIVGAIVTGYWEELSYVCSLILDGVVLSLNQIADFKRDGMINAHQPLPSDIICHCMQVPLGKIIAAIESNQSIDAVCDQTGAGMVCGGCRPRIREMLDKIKK